MWVFNRVEIDILFLVLKPEIFFKDKTRCRFIISFFSKSKSRGLWFTGRNQAIPAAGRNGRLTVQQAHQTPMYVDTWENFEFG